MKLRLIDRILIALSGLLLLALAVWMALDALSVAPSLSEFLANLLYVDAEAPLSAWIVVGVCAVPALLGVFDICMLFRRRKGKRGFIAQRAENGEISISVKTIETLVVKCARKHGEIAVQSVAVEEERNGLLIKLRAVLPSGMNIPLAVGTLQKQIKQYITACSGVDVSEVRVKVDTTDRPVENLLYAVSDETPALPVEQPEPAPVPAEAVAPVEMPAEEPEPISEEREQLTHQRLFSTPEEPAMVPVPPVAEPETPADEPEEPAPITLDDVPEEARWNELFEESEEPAEASDEVEEIEALRVESAGQEEVDDGSVTAEETAPEATADSAAEAPEESPAGPAEEAEPEHPAKTGEYTE